MSGREIPVDLHSEPRKGLTALLSLLLLLLPTLILTLSVAAEKPSAGLTVYRPSIVPVPLSFAAPPQPAPREEVVAAPPPKKKTAPPPPSEAELALKQTKKELEEEKKKREAENKKRKEEEKKKREDEARKKKEQEEEKRRKEAEEKKKREAEKKKKEEEKKRKEEAEKKRREEEEKRRREKEAEEKVRAAEARAAELRAQAEAEANAAEAARLAGLKDIYRSRIILQIERQLDTPIHLLNRDDIKAVVEVKLHPDGELRGWPKISSSSGFPEYDEAAIRAVIQAAPLLVPSDEPELVKEFLELNLLVCNDFDSPHCRR